LFLEIRNLSGYKMHEKITLIVNPISGGGKDKKELLKFVSDYFSQKGNRIALKATSRRGEATEFAQQSVRDSDDLVVVVGGDGTINEVASGLVGSEVAMGIIPRGSGNGLARTLKIPQNIAKACKLISDGDRVKIDMGKANGRFFALVAGIGFDAVVGKRFDEHHKRGPISYFFIGTKEFFLYKPEIVKISFGDQSFEVEPFLIAAANGQQYGNNAIIAPDAKLNDGFLDITIIHYTSVFQLMRALPKLFSGRLKGYPDADFHKTKSLRIQRSAPGVLNIDGEPVDEKSVIEISILPKCLKIIAPQNSPGLA